MLMSPFFTCFYCFSVGHHCFVPILERLGNEYCKMHFVDKTIKGYGTETTPLKKGRTMWNRELWHTRDYMEQHPEMQNLMRMKFNSVPMGMGPLYRTGNPPKRIYHIEYVLDVFKGMPNVTIKYIYLDRNFYKTVASHYLLDGGFEGHALMMERYARYIRSEFNLIQARTSSNICRTVHYEWLQKFSLGQFGAFIGALIEFLEWKNCQNVDIEALYAMIRPSSTKTVANELQYTYAMGLDWQMDEIPLLLNTTELGYGDDVIDFGASFDMWNAAYRQNIAAERHPQIPSNTSAHHASKPNKPVHKPKNKPMVVAKKKAAISTRLPAAGKKIIPSL